MFLNTHTRTHTRARAHTHTHSHYSTHCYSEISFFFRNTKTCWFYAEIFALPGVICN